MNENKPKSKFNLYYVFFIILCVLILCLVFANRGSDGVKITDTQAEQLVTTGVDIDKDGTLDYASKIIYKDGTCYVLKADSKIDEKNFPTYSDYYFGSTSDGYETLKTLCRNAGTISVQFSYELAGISWTDVIFPILYIVFGIFLIYMVFKMISASNKSAMQFGHTKTKLQQVSKVRFSDIAGMDEEKQELEEIVEFLKNPQKFTRLGARIPKGVLLVGNPGTGKTLLARAVAGESKVPFISISGSDFVEMFVGVGASRVRDLFDQAKKNKPCIVFIDEIDAVGRQRGAGLGGGNDEREQTLNQLLVEMDGFEANEGIIVLAATNRADVLDPALMRPGRFDRQVYVHVPDVKGREGILKIHARNKPLDEDVDFLTLARITTGFTGADIENMLNEAAILAARAGRPKITMVDIQEGINKVVMGPQKKSRVVTEYDKKVTAYHESGHAILGKLLPHCEEIQEVSIISRGMAAGYTMSRPENDNQHLTYNKIMDEMAMCMGGRIAEEIIFGDISTGASNDIQQATRLASNMVKNWGMSKKLGFVTLGSEEQLFIGRDYQTKNDFSEKTASTADDEIISILNSNYKRAKTLLEKNVKILHEMAKLLLEKETIYKDEVDMIMQGKKTEEIAKYMDEKLAEQKQKEEKIKSDASWQQKLDAYKKKVDEAKKLLDAKQITEQEYDVIAGGLREFEKEASGQKSEKADLTAEQKEVAETKQKAENKTEKAKVEDKAAEKTEVKEEKSEKKAAEKQKIAKKPVKTSEKATKKPKKSESDGDKEAK